jgi:hypothetical protein
MIVTQKLDQYKQPGVLLMVSTLLDIDPSIQEEVTVPLTWGGLTSLESTDHVSNIFHRCLSGH